MTTTFDPPAPGGPPEVDPPPAPPHRRRRRPSDLTPGDRVIQSLLAVLAFIPAAGLVFLAYEMAKEAEPAIIFNGWSFFTHTGFSIGNQFSSAPLENHHGYKALPDAHFGVLLMLFGTLVSSVIALVIAVPVSVAGAVLLVERIPRRLQGPLGIFLELLAGIPSVVWGLWGYLTFGPFLAAHVYPALADLHIPWVSRPVNNGEGVLTTSLVLAVMIIPIIASTTRELMRSVPTPSKEAAVALGLTRYESVRVVTIPFVRTGIVAAAILGWARALGETVAVLLISGASLTSYPHSVFDAFATMAESIAQVLDSALADGTGMALHSLAEVGLALLFITLVTNFIGRIITSRLAGPGLPVGRGI